MIQCLLARHDVSATTTCSFLKVGYGGLSMRSILTGNNLEYQHKYARGKIFQILGFYASLYNISNFSIGVNFPFKEQFGFRRAYLICSSLSLTRNLPSIWGRGLGPLKLQIWAMLCTIAHPKPMPLCKKKAIWYAAAEN